MRVLLVDDDAVVRMTVQMILEHSNFHVTTASNVAEALGYISSQEFDVLLSDLHMPGAGDGLTVVSAMRHANPKTVTLLLSAFPEMAAAATAILLQADRILVKPIKVDALIDVINESLAKGNFSPRPIETVATILERTATASIAGWLDRVHREEKIMVVPLRDDLRCEHLPQLFRDLVVRLRSFKALGTKELISAAASAHGMARRKQGYTAGMLVEESRLLQVSIFNTLQHNLGSIDFSVLLIGVMSIADEVDSQLSQAMESYMKIPSQDDLRAA